MGPPVQLNVREIMVDFPLDGRIESIMAVQDGIHGIGYHAGWVDISHRDVVTAGRGKLVHDRFRDIGGEFYYEAREFVMHDDWFNKSLIRGRGGFNFFEAG